jgi:hypothetical protein
MRLLLSFLTLVLLSSCVATDNPTVDGFGTPTITACGIVPAEDGATYVPQRPQLFNGRLHPDVFYAGWSQLDTRNDLRKPTTGYDGNTAYEDKLFVSREQPDGTVRTWQLLPARNVDCTDAGRVRIHSFDVAPDGRHLYISMRQGADTNLGIYELNINTRALRKISLQNNIHFITPTYVGNDPYTGHPMLFVGKTVTGAEIPLNYGAVLRDEYDRQPTTLIHKMDALTGDVVRIGFNNSHQQDPVLIHHNGLPLVVFTQWEHQATVNRFSLWKMQIDGSDNFTFYGQESATDKLAMNLTQPREIQSGPYQGYVLMTQGSRPLATNPFALEGDIVMTKRVNLDIRSPRVYLEQVSSNTVNDNLSRNPEHYNDQAFVYAYRANKDVTYNVFTRDFTPLGQGARKQLSPTSNFYHFVQPRSYYPPTAVNNAPTNGSLGQSRTSFTNTALNGSSGFLVQNLASSDNGVQHQLRGVNATELSMQFFIPSHTLDNSQAIGKMTGVLSPELSVPASGFISPEADGSFGAVVKNGLYVWKVNKRFNLQGANVWIPVRAERQEVSFVPNRVNACNQCHQERSQANFQFYQAYNSTAGQKMAGNLAGVANVAGYDAYANVPDFHKDIVPLLTTPNAVSGRSCASCHNDGSHLNLANHTGTDSQVPAWLALLSQAHTTSVTGALIPYVNDSINPMGMDNQYHPAPFLWSLLLNDDLTVPPDATHPNNASRNLDRAGDYGAVYDANVLADITAINAQYDHSKHWTAAQTQAFITYTSTQSRVGLSNRIQFTPNQLSVNSVAAQRAYQVMVKRCFQCHSNSKNSLADALRPLETAAVGFPLKKRFNDATKMRERNHRFVVDGHIPYMTDMMFSKLTWQSDVTASMSRTMQSARRMLDFNDLPNSPLFRYATATGLDAATVQHAPVLAVGSADYNDLYTWASGGVNTNQAPTLVQPATPIVIQEYAPPMWQGPISWSDADGDLAQMKMRPVNAAGYDMNDSMVAFDYYSFTQAAIQSYAILGDRGQKQLEFILTDGLETAVQRVPVTVTSDYVVPPPMPTLTNDFYAFYTVKADNSLHRIDKAGVDTVVGIIPANTLTWATVYRRADRGWLFFNDQANQIVYVVDETNAQIITRIHMNHQPNADRAGHKQTTYLLWWRPADPYTGNPGELQAIMESKLAQFASNNGDFYVGLIDATTLDQQVAANVQNITVVPQWRTKMQGKNYVAAYAWRNATFATQLVVQGVDQLHALNLVTGKTKGFGAFTFAADPYSTAPAATYQNVRAVVVAQDGGFFGFNQDINNQVTMFNFDPVTKTQQPVALPPAWVQQYIQSIQTRATPFLVIGPRI